MTIVDLIEAILRGGASAIALTMTYQVLAPRPLTWPAIYGALFFLGAGIFGIVALPEITARLGASIHGFKIIAMATPAFFWLFVKALHDDNYDFRALHLLPPAALSGIYLTCIPWPELRPIAMWAQLSIVVVLMAHTIYIVRCCMVDDLVASRRHLAKTLAWLIPLIAVAIIGIELVEIANLSNPDTGAPAWARLSAATVFVVISAILMTSLSALRKTLLPPPLEVAHKPNPDNYHQTAADRIDLGRLRDLMEGGAYASSGLTIGALAAELNMPEHRLRRLINQGLGYRNFAAYLNDHRIAAAKHMLAKPDLARTQITTLAYDVGYGSLAPFNRAFRERTGMSPSEFRETTLLKGG